MKDRICVDFDGTIYDGLDIMPGCISKLHELRKHYIISIFSARATEAERIHMKTVLDENQVPYDEILPPKPNAVAYIDDKGVHFTSWAEISS
jgi:ribonucleotide monophosphatase NagD (HAD superfamily)